jgi:hypothetical protein
VSEAQVMGSEEGEYSWVWKALWQGWTVTTAWTEGSAVEWQFGVVINRTRCKECRHVDRN